MRLSVIGAAFLVSVSTAAAQSRWTFSVGPEWTRSNQNSFYGGRVRAEYDLITPTSPVRLRVEAGGFWSPTQNFDVTYLDNSSAMGSHQYVDLTFGVSGDIAPLPRSRFSPYLAVAALARQTWGQGEALFRNPDGSLASSLSERTRSFGDVFLAPAIGLRTRLGDHMFQLEMRWDNRFDRRSLLLGTSLPF